MENQSLQLGCYAIPNRAEARNLRFELDGHGYTWSGGFGAILKSYEKGVKPGEIRMIAGIPFYAYQVSNPELALFSFLKSKKEVWWTIPSQHLSSEWIRDFKRAIMGD